MAQDEAIKKIAESHQGFIPLSQDEFSAFVATDTERFVELAIKKDSLLRILLRGDLDQADRGDLREQADRILAAPSVTAPSFVTSYYCPRRRRLRGCRIPVEMGLEPIAISD